jgi:hypothetical protein
VEEVIKKKGNEYDSHLQTLEYLPSSETPLPYRNNLEDWDELIEYLKSGMRIEIDSISE